MHNIYAVIMAGGSGTRFWPLSRKAWPKQFLSLANTEETLLQSTVHRIRLLFAPANIYVVTAERHAQITSDQLPFIPPENILAEPIGRNTAPCVGWAAAHIRRKDPEGVVAVLPSDPQIEDENEYLIVLKRALLAAERGAIVTVGIAPTRPETGYGYLEVGETIDNGIHRVNRFIEKPNLPKAKEFLEKGNYLWNSGMFFFRTDVILNAISMYLPDLYSALEGFDEAARQGNETALVMRLYGSLPSISIDNGVMERSEHILVVPGSFGWYDIGSWTTAWELARKDANGNALPSESVVLDARNCYARLGQNKVIAMIGVEDLVVVDTPDALLVMKRDRAQDVKTLVDELNKRDNDSFL